MKRVCTITLVVVIFVAGFSGCGDNKTEIKKEVDMTELSGNPSVLMKTTLGDIVIELDRERAPITVDNFLGYVNSGFYNGTIFHRVIENFMIQGGGFTADMKQKTTQKPIKNEADNGLKNLRGTIAMARTQVVNSATSQFFINVVDNDNLNYRGPDPSDYGYAVFGKVVDGMDVVDAIRSVPTTTMHPYRDVPREPVIIEQVSVITEEK